jgi:hypothetical protein
MLFCSFTKEGIRQHFAVLGRDDRGKLILASVEQFTECKHDRRALGNRRRAPASECGFCCGYASVDIVCGCQWHGASDSTGCGIEDITARGRVALGC